MISMTTRFVPDKCGAKQCQCQQMVHNVYGIAVMSSRDFSVTKISSLLLYSPKQEKMKI